MLVIYIYAQYIYIYICICIPLDSQFVDDDIPKYLDNVNPKVDALTNIAIIFPCIFDIFDSSRIQGGAPNIAKLVRSWMKLMIYGRHIELLNYPLVIGQFAMERSTIVNR